MRRILLLALSLMVGSELALAQSYIAPYSGAVSRTNNSKLSDIVSVFDFIPVTLQPAIKAGTSTTDVSSYLSAMQSAVPTGVKFLFPSGQYNIGAGATAMTGRTIDITGVTFTGGGSITGAVKTASTSGTLSSGDCVEFDASGNLVASGAACGSGTITALTGDVTASGSGSVAATVARINGATLGTTTATSGNILIGSGTAWVTNPVSGDITVGSTGVTAVGANKITDGMLRQSGALSVVGRSANSTGNVADITATPSSGAVLRESGSVVGFGTIATAGIANNAVTDAKLRQGAARSVIGVAGNSTANVADIQGTTDQILRVTGAGTGIGFGSIDLSKSAAIGTSILGLSNFALGTTGYALIGNGASASSYQGFLQAGTGATTRTWQNKARDTISVLDFGAVGNGVADDTAAINAALTYASTSGKCVYFPGVRGASYLVTALVWPGQTSPYTQPCIFGDGYYSYILQTAAAAAAGTPILTLGSGTLNDSQDAIVRDIQLVATNPQAAGGSGIYAKGTARPKIINVNFYNVYNGIELNGINYPVIDGVFMSAVGNDGIKLYNAWNCSGITPTTKTTNGITAGGGTVVLMADTSGISVGYDAFNITRKVYLQGTVQSINAGVSVTMSTGQTVAIASGDSIIFGRDCQGSGGNITGRTLIVSPGHSGVHFAGGVGGFVLDAVDIEVSTGPAILATTTASAGITNREFTFTSAVQVADGAAEAIAFEANSVTALWASGGIYGGGAATYGVRIEAQGAQYNPVDTGARINITGITVPSPGLGGLLWSDSGQLSLSGNVIRDAYGVSATAVVLNSSAGVGRVNIDGGYLGGNAGYGIWALAVPETITITGVNVTGNTLGGINGLTPSATVICTGNVGGTDACSSNSSTIFGSQQTTQGSLVLANTAAGAFATTIKSSNSATAAATYTLPTAIGAAGSVLSDAAGNGVLSWAAAPAASLTVGSSPIASGTTTRVLYDNAGVLGEYTISGSGNVAMTTSPAFTTPALGVATGTSLALNGAAIGTNALAVTGTVNVSSTITSSAAVSSPQVILTGGMRLLAFTSEGMQLKNNSSSVTSYLYLPANETLQLGTANSATPAAQTLQTQGSRSGTDSNVGGANLTIKSGTGTGTGTLSSLILQSPVAVASGTGAQTMTTGLTIKDGTHISAGYTVATLPATNVAGARAHVTDQASACPAVGAALTGGGAVVCPVFNNGAAWVGGYLLKRDLTPSNDNLPMWLNAAA